MGLCSKSLIINTRTSTHCPACLTPTVVGVDTSGRLVRSLCGGFVYLKSRATRFANARRRFAVCTPSSSAELEPEVECTRVRAVEAAEPRPLELELEVEERQPIPELRSERRHAELRSERSAMQLFFAAALAASLKIATPGRPTVLNHESSCPGTRSRRGTTGRGATSERRRQY
jgi:hypothetical protein